MRSAFFLVSLSAVLAGDINGIQVSDKCAAYITAGVPKVKALGPAFSNLAEASKGTPAEKAASESDALTKVLLGEYEKLADKPLSSLTDEDKQRIQGEEAQLPGAEKDMQAVYAMQDSLPAPVQEKLAALTTAMDDMKAYGRGGLRPCLRDVNTLKTAAQNSGLMPPPLAQRQAIAMYLGFNTWATDAEETKSEITAAMQRK